MDENVTSGIVRNRLKKRVVLPIVGAYGWALWGSFQLSPVLAGAIALYSALAIGVAGWMLKREIAQLSEHVGVFRHVGAFEGFGNAFAEFHHVFFFADSILKTVESAIESALTTKAAATPFSKLKLKDIDPEIERQDTRRFLLSHVADTSRGSGVSLALESGTYGQVHSIRWWVLVRGFIDRSNRFIYLASAPLYVPLAVLPYLTRSLKVTPLLRVTYGGFYNALDIIQLVRSTHYVVIEALVEALDANGIDTSDLKIQRAQVLNINVSGGKVGFGNIVQGAANRVGNVLKKVKAA